MEKLCPSKCLFPRPLQRQWTGHGTFTRGHAAGTAVQFPAVTAQYSGHESDTLRNVSGGYLAGSTRIDSHLWFALGAAPATGHADWTDGEFQLGTISGR